METISVHELLNPVPLVKLMIKIGAMALALMFLMILFAIPVILFVPLTIFAPGVQMNRFDNRLVGMTRDQVIAIHGPPLSILVYSSETPFDPNRRPMRFAPREEIEPILDRIKCPRFYLGQGAPFPYFNSEILRYSDREGGMVWHLLSVKIDSKSGKVSGVGNTIYHE